MEFADFRPYQPGDDLRYVDWKIAARSDRWVVKQYEEETNLRATIVLDVSRSMDWRGAAAAGRVTKRAYAEQLTAALALLLLRQRDAVGLIRFDDAVRTEHPAARPHRRSGAASSPRSPSRATAAPPISPPRSARRRASSRGAAWSSSSATCSSTSTPVIPALRGLRAAGHDVTVLHVMDPAERDFTLAGEARYTDPEIAARRPRRRGRRARRVPRHGRSRRSPSGRTASARSARATS